MITSSVFWRIFMRSSMMMVSSSERISTDEAEFFPCSLIIDCWASLIISWILKCRLHITNVEQQLVLTSSNGRIEYLKSDEFLNAHFICNKATDDFRMNRTVLRIYVRIGSNFWIFNIFLSNNCKRWAVRMNLLHVALNKWMYCRPTKLIKSLLAG